jgi:antitoxin YefM
MRSISSKELGNILAETLDRVVKDHEPVIVVRDGKPSAVILSLDDFKSYDETAYLLSTPANAEALRESIAELEAGGGAEKTLIE